jgi:radical SAM superfamily enzyme YgiQ (UPF0313 family)
MKILLVITKYEAKTETTIPGNIALLAAILEGDGHEVAVFDFNVMDDFDGFVSSFKPEAVGFSCSTANIDQGLEVASRIKKLDRSVKIMFGGIHATVLPEQLLKRDFIDIVVRGEGEETIRELFQKGLQKLSGIKGISYKSRGRVVHNPLRGPVKDLDTLPLPAFHLLPVKRYDRAAIMTSRGCPGRCTFCSSYIMFGSKIRFRNEKNIVDEMELMKSFGFDYIWFSDDTFMFDRARVHRICDETLKRGLNMKWSCMSRVNTVDIDILRKMKKAGCITIGYGIESADPEVLRASKKGIMIKDVIRAFRLTHKAGIDSGAFLMVGMPKQTWKSIEITNELIKKIKPSVTGISILVPYPNTEIYRELRACGAIGDNQNWEDFRMSTGSGIASPYILELDEKICDLTKEEIIKAYNLLYSTGTVISMRKRLKSPKNIIMAASRIRSYKDVRRQISRMASLFRAPRPTLTDEGTFQ